MCFSLGNGFLYINKHVSKQICPVCLQGWKDWIYAPIEAPCGGWGGGVYTHFALGLACLTLPPPLFFLLSWSSPIAFLPVDSHVP